MLNRLCALLRALCAVESVINPTKPTISKNWRKIQTIAMKIFLNSLMKFTKMVISFILGDIVSMNYVYVFDHNNVSLRYKNYDMNIQESLILFTHCFDLIHTLLTWCNSIIENELSAKFAIFKFSN